MKPALRKILEGMAQEYGVEVLGTERTGKSHHKCHVRSRDGRTQFIMFPSTPSDWRWTMRKKAEFRQFARGHSAVLQREPEMA